MLEKIAEIKKALNNDCQLAALALALTLPDICGQIEYSKEKGVGKRYKDWFSKYAQSEWDTQENCPYNFDAEACYQLRCHYLHSGNTDIRTDYTFNLATGDLTQLNLIQFHGENQKVIALHNVNDICNKLCTSAEKYYNKINDHEKFASHNIQVVKIKVTPKEQNTEISIDPSPDLWKTQVIKRGDNNGQ